MTDPDTASLDRRERWWQLMTGGRGTLEQVLALADAEQADLKAEVESLRAFVEPSHHAEQERDALSMEVEPWLHVCGSCDAGLPMSCICPGDDPRTLIGRLDANRVALKVEVDRLRTEATRAQLAAETGAERAQTEAANLKAEADRYAQSWNEAEDDLNEARATTERVKTLADDYEPTGLVTVEDLRAALDAPTEPAPGLDPGTAEGSGLWLSTPLEDPPPVDPLAAARERLDKAMRQQEPT